MKTTKVSKHLCNFWKAMADIRVIFGSTLPVCQRASGHILKSILKSYNESDSPESVANYQSYYLGSVVFSINPSNAKKSIIDGQQRITSITLLGLNLRNGSESAKLFKVPIYI